MTEQARSGAYGPVWEPVVNRPEDVTLPCMCRTPSLTTCEFCQVFGAARIQLGLREALVAQRQSAPPSPVEP